MRGACPADTRAGHHSVRPGKLTYVALQPVFERTEAVKCSQDGSNCDPGATLKHLHSCFGCLGGPGVPKRSNLIFRSRSNPSPRPTEGLAPRGPGDQPALRKGWGSSVHLVNGGVLPLKHNIEPGADLAATLAELVKGHPSTSSACRPRAPLHRMQSVGFFRLWSQKDGVLPLSLCERWGSSVFVAFRH